jgi:hypothetical protein
MGTASSDTLARAFWRDHESSGVRDLLRTRGESLPGVVRVGMCPLALQLPCWNKSAHQCEPTLSLFSQVEDSGGAAWKRLGLPELLCGTASFNRRDIRAGVVASRSNPHCQSSPDSPKASFGTFYHKTSYHKTSSKPVCSPSLRPASARYSTCLGRLWSGTGTVANATRDHS